jgi:hypothetical protein
MAVFLCVFDLSQCSYSPRKHKKSTLSVLSGWSHQDLNLGPSDYESDALTN